MNKLIPLHYHDDFNPNPFLKEDELTGGLSLLFLYIPEDYEYEKKGDNHHELQRRLRPTANERRSTTTP